MNNLNPKHLSPEEVQHYAGLSDDAWLKALSEVLDQKDQVIQDLLDEEQEKA